MRTQTIHCQCRSWKFTPDGTRLVIGYVNGDLQVGVVSHHVTHYI